MGIKMKKGLIPKLHKYFFEECRAEVLPAMRDFFDDPSIGPGESLTTNDPKEEELFMEWITFDYKFSDNKSLIDHYLKDHRTELDQDDASVLYSLKTNEYGFFETKAIAIGKSLRLTNLQDGKDYKVTEHSGTFGAKVGQVLLCRVGKVIDHYELVGCDAIVIPPELVREFKKVLQLSDESFSPKWTRNLYKRDGPSPKHAITEERRRIKEEFEERLAVIDAPFDFDYILDVIYHEDGQDDLTKIIRIFDNGDVSELENVLELATDTWNYFPHKALGGKAPTEMED